MKKWLKRFLWFLALTITGIVLLPVAWVAYNHVRWPPETFRYRVTLNVKYNGEIKSGSAVLESRQTRANLLRLVLADGSSEYSVRGIAPIVNLGEAGWMFVSVDRFRLIPWHVYCDGGTSTAWGEVAYLPTKTPRRVIVFNDEPRNRIGGKGGIYWIPPGRTGPRLAKNVEIDNIRDESGFHIEFVGFVIEKTDDPVLTQFEFPDEWTLNRTSGVQESRLSISKLECRAEF